MLFRSKILAAHRAGCSEVILPKDNDKDMEDIPDFVRREMKITFVRHMDELLPIVLADQNRKPAIRIKSKTSIPSGKGLNVKGRTTGGRGKKR